jgi:hypothetical protein
MPPSKFNNDVAFTILDEFYLPFFVFSNTEQINESIIVLEMFLKKAQEHHGLGFRIGDQQHKFSLPKQQSG